MEKKENDTKIQSNLTKKRIFLDKEPSTSKRNSAKYEIEKASFRDSFNIKDYSRDKTKE
jgi:hypothetical protein